MIHTDYAGILRQSMIAIMGADARQKAEATRPGESPFGSETLEPLGTLLGYRYIRRSGQTALALGLPGELAQDMSSEWYMDLTPDFPVSIQKGDRLTFENGDARRVSITRGSGGFTGKDIYRLYKLEVI